MSAILKVWIFFFILNNDFIELTNSLSQQIESNELKSDNGLQVVKNGCQTIKYTKKITRRNCNPKNIDLNMCLGYCMSEVYTGWNGQKVHTLCNVCKPSQTKKIKVKFHCYDGKKRQVQYIDKIIACDCKRTNCYTKW